MFHSFIHSVWFLREGGYREYSEALNIEFCWILFTQNSGKSGRCLGYILRPQQRKKNRNRENLIAKISCLFFRVKKRESKLLFEIHNFSILHSLKECVNVYFKCYTSMAAVQCIYRNGGRTSGWKRFFRGKFENQEKCTTVFPNHLQKYFLKKTAMAYVKLKIQNSSS